MLFRSPTSGTVLTNGRIAALLELGAGFNPEFTGRENVYMNGAILGLSEDQVDARFEEIASFADIGDFIEQPVKTYSSGMFVRLAFASNIMSKPEIMIVDEALSVGDMNFQAKCMTALTRIQDNGATILFVSHDVGSVKSLCSRGVYLERGKVVTVGPAADVAERYIRTMQEEMNAEHRKQARVPGLPNDMAGQSSQQITPKDELNFKRSQEFETRVAQFRFGSGEVKSTCVELVDTDGNDLVFVEFNQDVVVKVYFEAYAEKELSVNISIFDDKKNNIIGCGFPHIDQPYLVTKQGSRYLAEYALKLQIGRAHV